MSILYYNKLRYEQFLRYGVLFTSVGTREFNEIEESAEVAEKLI